MRVPLARAAAVIALCSVVLVAAPGCAGVAKLVSKPSPVQLVTLAADATDAANKLGEIVLQLQTSAHKLKLAGVLSREADDAVQRAAISFANDKDLAVAAFGKAANAAQIAAAAAPLIGSVMAIKTSLASVSGIKTFTGTAGLLSLQLPDLLKQSSDLVKSLGGAL